MMEGDTAPLRVVASIDTERVSLRAGQSELGSWPHDAVQITPAGSGFDLVIGGERARLVPDDPAAFARSLPPPPAPHRERRRPALLSHLGGAIGRPRVVVAAGVLLVAVALLVVAPEVLGALLTLAGAALLVASIVYGADPIRASRLPRWLRPSGMAALGAIAVVAGLVLVFL